MLKQILVSSSIVFVNQYLYILSEKTQILQHCTFIFIIKPTRCTNFTNLFWHETLYVSDSSSVHHQEFFHCTLSNGTCHAGL